MAAILAFRHSRMNLLNLPANSANPSIAAGGNGRVAVVVYTNAPLGRLVYYSCVAGGGDRQQGRCNESPGERNVGGR